jgi:hypothetical protein
MSEAKYGIKPRPGTVSMRIDELVVLSTTNPGVLAHSISRSLRDRCPSGNIAASRRDGRQSRSRVSRRCELKENAAKLNAYHCWV